MLGLQLGPVLSRQKCNGQQSSPETSTTVVDRRSAEANHVFCSGNAEHEIDVVFAIGTSAADAQRRAIRASAGE